MELTGKVAVVTGASSGIGEAAARALARSGMTVYAVARRLGRLEALAAAEPSIVPHHADVTIDEDVAALAQRVRDDQGACHVLVNNAGVAGGSRFRSAEDYADAERIIDVNLLGAMRCAAAFGELLTASAPARVINVASVAGKIGLGAPAYSASKFGLVGFSEALDAGWRPRGVAVCQLNPGFIRTEGFPKDDLVRSPFGRLVPGPEPVARAIVDVARSGQRERTVPRWYRALVILRHLAAPVVFGVGGRLRR